MGGLDEAVLLFVNQLARVSWTFDTMTDFLSRSHLLKGGVVAAVLWWLWFREQDTERTRSHLIATLLASLVAIAVARALALTLPFRVRPLHAADLAFVRPYGTPETRLETWSSMPSDHAVLFFTLATGVWFVSRVAGAAVTAWVVLIIALPRVYLGLHYPSDLLVGAAIGAVIAIAGNAGPLRTRIAGPALRWLHASPATFHACLFLLTFQITVLFGDGRDIATLLYQLISARFSSG